MNIRTVVQKLLVLFLVLGWVPSAKAAFNCTLPSVTGIPFGTYNVFSATRTTQTGSIQYQCKGSGGVITIDLSPSPGGTYSTPRTMKSGSDILQYNLYPDVTNSQVWGNGTNGTYHYTATLSSGTHVLTLTVYGTIPAGQDVAVGSYTDTITVTISF